MKRDWCRGNEQTVNVVVATARQLWIQFRSITPVIKHPPPAGETELTCSHQNAPTTQIATRQYTIHKLGKTLADWHAVALIKTEAQYQIILRVGDEMKETIFHPKAQSGSETPTGDLLSNSFDIILQIPTNRTCLSVNRKLTKKKNVMCVQFVVSFLLRVSYLKTIVV